MFIPVSVYTSVHGVALGYTVVYRSCVENSKRQLEREVQTPALPSHLLTSSLSLLKEGLIVKSYNNSWIQPTNTSQHRNTGVSPFM